ncbi:hypothetical protein CLOM_g8342 [Closterium sp. NIES-68]|nr:hypothetical protein CLOM_g8342 [Closterium sp. NIES-68]
MGGQLEAWFLDPVWSDEAPDMTVTVGTNALCQLDGTATVAFPPDAVFSLVCDPYNHRVFKNVKAVRNHRVVRDCNGVKEVEMDMAFSFQLPFFTGTFDAHMRMVQDRSNRTMTFALTRPGFMRKFEGFWKVEPLLVPESESSATSLSSPKLSSLRRCESDESSNGRSTSSDGKSESLTLDSKCDSLHSSCSYSDESDESSDVKKDMDDFSTESLKTNGTHLTVADGIRVASRLLLCQIVQPSVAPPAIFKRCLHSILQLATRDVLLVFQQEAARLRAARGEEVRDEVEEEKKGVAALTSRMWGLLSMKA